MAINPRALRYFMQTYKNNKITCVLCGNPSLALYLGGPRTDLSRHTKKSGLSGQCLAVST